MNFDEALEFVRQNVPKVLYLGGKTSTGKSTFARRLGNELDYKVVELDKIVVAKVIKPRGLVDEGQAFFEVYKQRNRLDWIGDFVDGAREEVKRIESAGHRVIMDGAIAHPLTLQEVLLSVSGAIFLYFHPQHLDVYERNLTSRFMDATEQSSAGLPLEFWKLVDRREFRRFCETHTITDPLRRAIHEYAVRSQKSSEERLEIQKSVVDSMVVVRI